MAINKKLIHFKNFNNFNSKKLSANEANTQYTLGVDGAVTNGSPDILYQSVVWIKDTKQQWTHGQLYGIDEDLYIKKIVDSDVEIEAFMVNGATFMEDLEDESLNYVVIQPSSDTNEGIRTDLDIVASGIRFENVDSVKLSATADNVLKFGNNQVSFDGHTHSQYLTSIPSEYITESELNTKTTELTNNINTQIENIASKINSSSNVLWIGTSIPAGDITFSNNGTTQSTTSDLGSNNYPKMVADALGFNLYNNARGASFVCFYPSSEDGTSNWAGKDWTEYQNEVHKGYSLSASMAQVEEKFSALGVPEWLINSFKSYSYESLIIPYIDGTIASCDTVILDHGYNDRQQILSETSWHIGEGEQMVIGSGRDWLLKLQDPFEKTLTCESFFQGCWWADENAEDTKKYYWKAMVFLCKKIWAVNPRIKIIIGNYFATKSNIFGAEYGNDRLGEFICLANSGLANWLRCQCVDVHKYTGIYNRNLAAGNDYQIFCPDNVHPHSDSTGKSNRIIAGIYINQLRGIV